MTAQPSDPQLSTRGYVLFLLTALSAMNQFDRQLLNVLIEPIRHEFGLGDFQLGLLSGVAFAVIYTVLSIPAAIWAVRGNRRNLLAASAVVWGAMTACCGLVQSYWQLLIARFGVGVGEAGGMPPSHAMISDLYGAEERGAAMSTWSAGINIGVFFSFLVGGVVGRYYGWRAAFWVAGAVTVLLALLLRLTVREPPRIADRHGRSFAALPSRSLLMATIRTMLFEPVARHVVIGASVASVVTYASLTWFPSFLVRSHGMTLAEVGIYLAFVIGLGGAVGTWAGGRLSDRLRKRDIRWSLWLVALVLAGIKPFMFGFLLVDTTILALAIFLVPGIIGAVYIGPSLAVLHNRVPADLRPVASAVFLLIVNFLGLGLGPLLVGSMSQFVFAEAGPDALRYALVMVQVVGIWAAWHYYRAGARLASSARIAGGEQPA